jgi:hypothetical protein
MVETWLENPFHAVIPFTPEFLTSKMQTPLILRPCYFENNQNIKDAKTPRL